MGTGPSQKTARTIDGSENMIWAKDLTGKESEKLYMAKQKMK